jgi:hypothetical protein
LNFPNDKKICLLNHFGDNIIVFTAHEDTTNEIVPSPDPQIKSRLQHTNSSPQNLTSPDQSSQKSAFKKGHPSYSVGLGSENATASDTLSKVKSGNVEIVEESGISPAPTRISQQSPIATNKDFGDDSDECRYIPYKFKATVLVSYLYSLLTQCFNLGI